MRDLRLQLDDLQFDELAEIGRSLIPSLAPQWTDHNVHDPGIMLTELMAWIADAQIYSLGRSRRDERLAYASLMGLKPSGATPASGLVWPAAQMMTNPQLPIAWARGTVAGPSSDVFADGADSPKFHPVEPVYLATCRLTAVTSIAEDGTRTDLTRVNQHGGTSFLPFGSAPTRKSRLELEFTQGAVGATIAAGTSGYLSIGFQIDRESTGPAHPMRSRLRATLVDARGEHSVPVYQDSTAMFMQSGVLLLQIDPQAMALDDSFTLTIDCPSGAWLVTPRVSRILPNVIPVIQSERREWADIGMAQGVPDEELSLFDEGANESAAHGDTKLQFDDLKTSFAVRTLGGGGEQSWTVVETFDASAPEDRHVFVDVKTARLIFGNGINGSIPERGAAVQASYSVSNGREGNLPANMSWRVSGMIGLFGTNFSALRGGRDALTPIDLQVSAREEIENARPIVTPSALEQSALDARDLGVTRAHELLPRVNERTVLGSRRLLVMGTHVDENVLPETLEPDAWRDAVRARLAPRLPMGQRLSVIGPRYVVVAVQARLQTKPRLSPLDVQKRALQALRARFALVNRRGEALWPLGRSVSAVAVSGWLRKVEGVSRVLDVKLVVDGVVLSKDEITMPRTGLPLFRPSQSVLQVLRDGERTDS